MSCPGDRRDFPVRQHSRTKRRARFRATALGYERTGTSTTLLAGREFERIWSLIPLQENRVPFAKILSISARFRTLSAFLYPCRGMIKPLPGGLGSVGLLLVGGRELGSPLGSAPLEHQSTALGLHAGAKAEFAISADFAGLIGTFHFPGSLVLWATAATLRSA
jgi:hypothetical protein